MSFFSGCVLTACPVSILLSGLLSPCLFFGCAPGNLKDFLQVNPTYSGAALPLMLVLTHGRGMRKTLRGAAGCCDQIGYCQLEGDAKTLSWSINSSN